MLASPRQSQSEEDFHTSSDARPALTRIPEGNNTFTIGGDDSDEEREGQHTPSQSSPSLQNSRRPSISSTDEGAPLQLRGLSEKARGKMPAGRPSFSRQNSIASQSSVSLFPSSPGNFTPTAIWVSCNHFSCVVSNLLCLTLLTDLYCLASSSLGYQSSPCILLSPSSQRFRPIFPTLLFIPVQTRKPAR